MFWGEESILLVIFLTKSFKFKKKYFAGVNISEKTENFDDFCGFCSPEFDRFLRDLAIFQLKCNEQHSSIPKRQIEIPATFS